jgi:hypothetical protein
MRKMVSQFTTDGFTKLTRFSLGLGLLVLLTSCSSVPESLGTDLDLAAKPAQRRYEQELPNYLRTREEIDLRLFQALLRCSYRGAEGSSITESYVFAANALHRIGRKKALRCLERFLAWSEDVEVEDANPAIDSSSCAAIVVLVGRLLFGDRSGSLNNPLIGFWAAEEHDTHSECRLPWVFVEGWPFFCSNLGASAYSPYDATSARNILRYYDTECEFIECSLCPQRTPAEILMQIFKQQRSPHSLPMYLREVLDWAKGHSLVSPDARTHTYEPGSEAFKELVRQSIDMKWSADTCTFECK